MEPRKYQIFWSFMVFMLSFLTGASFLGAMLIHDTYHATQDVKLDVGESILDSIPSLLRSVPRN